MSEFKDRIDEIMTDLKGRIRNPLILSFILVWMYFHWRFLYQGFSLDDEFGIDERLRRLEGYVTCKGWYGMVGKPLWVSFVSLIVYYLIAIVAQLAKVGGKYLYAWIFAKIDPNEFVLRTELEIEKKHSKTLKAQLDKANSEAIELTDFKDNVDDQMEKLLSQINTLKDELEKAKHNVNYNRSFKDKFETTLAYLFAQTQSINIQSPLQDLEKDNFSIINGRWRITASNFLGQKSGTLTELSIDENEVRAYDNSNYGKISKLVYDHKYNLLNFVIVRKESNEIYQLIRINKDEFIGFKNKEFTVFEKRKVDIS